MSFLSQPVTLQSLFGKDRKFGPITVQVIINESATDTLSITKQPVQQGASITDHAYKEPTTLSMQILFQDDLSTTLESIYQDLIDLQLLRKPFDVVTPKRKYPSMLISSLGQTTDKNTENILSISISFQQVILVSVSKVEIDRAKQKNPGATGATQPAGKKSALLTLIEGIGNFFR